MYLRSHFPPIPDITITNFHYTVFPEGSLQDTKTEDDFTIHVDVITGQQRSVKEYTRDVYDAVTALGMEKHYGGLKLESQLHRVGILSDNCMEYITVIQALIGLAVPFAPLSPFATQWELSYCLKKADVTHVLVHKAYFSRLYLAASELGIPDENIILFEGNSAPHAIEQEDWKRFQSFRNLIRIVQNKKIPQEPIRLVQSDSIAYLIFSSGTTGRPKAVMVSHGNLCYSIEQSLIYEAVMTEETKESELSADQSVSTNLAFLPFYHTYGLQVSCIRSIPKSRVSQIILPRWNLDLVLDLIPKYRINIFPVVPSNVHTLLNSPKYKEIDTSSVQTIIFGAAHLSRSMEGNLQSVFPNAVLSEGYALSESTAVGITRARPGNSWLLDKLGKYNTTATGILQAGFEALILRPDGTHCLPEEPGELYLKAGSVALGYWRDPESTAQTFLPTGWLRTGDIFSADSKGHFYFKERAKETLKISGLQVAPTEIEDAIYSEPSGLVKDAAVVGVSLPTSRFSDDKSPRAWIVLSEKGRELGMAHTRKVIEDWTRERLSKYKWLRGGIQFVDQIPRNPTGKILRKVLQDEYTSQRSHVHTKL